MTIWDKKKIKRFSVWDIALIKFSVAAITLFVITIWSGAMDWVHSVNTWYFLTAAVILGAVPFYKYYLKK